MEQPFVDPSEELDQLHEDAPADLFEDDEPQAPVMVRIRLNGKTIEVDEATAQIIEEHQAEQQRVISRQGQELGELRRRPVQEQRQQPQEPSQDDDLEFFQSPSKAMAKRLQEAEERAYQRIQLDMQRQNFWARFYADNQDLKDHEDMVQFVVEKYRPQLNDLEPLACHKEIARLANAALGRSGEKTGKTLPNTPARSERPSQATPARQAPAQPQPKAQLTLSAQLVEARKEQRRRAQYRIKDEDK